eukprot:1839938-Pleurochrysis_carterae.AAC.3
MLELGNLETQRVIGDGNCSNYVSLASCAAAKVPDIACWSISHATSDAADSCVMGKDSLARMEFLRRLAVRGLINTKWGRKLCLQYTPAAGESTWFWDHSLCTCKLKRCACNRRPKELIREHV